MIWYLPSCQFKAAFTDVSARIQTYLKEKGVSVTGCCKVSQDNFQPGDTVLNNCCSCMLITEEKSPEADVVSLYEYLLQDPDFSWPDLHGERITVQDCFRARDHRSEQEAIREMLRQMNAVPVELKENFENAAFDGVWLFAPKIPQEKFAPEAFGEINRNHITPVPQDQWEQKMKEHAAQYETDRVACYCNACLKGVKLGGANGVHILELAFPEHI